MEVKDAIADQIDMGAPPAPGTQRGFQEAVLGVIQSACKNRPQGCRLQRS